MTNIRLARSMCRYYEIWLSIRSFVRTNEDHPFLLYKGGQRACEFLFGAVDTQLLEFTAYGMKRQFRLVFTDDLLHCPREFFLWNGYASCRHCSPRSRTGTSIAILPQMSSFTRGSWHLNWPTIYCLVWVYYLSSTLEEPSGTIE